MARGTYDDSAVCLPPAASLPGSTVGSAGTPRSSAEGRQAAAHGSSTISGSARPRRASARGALS